jgi:hypothetical protein
MLCLPATANKQQTLSVSPLSVLCHTMMQRLLSCCRTAHSGIAAHSAITPPTCMQLLLAIKPSLPLLLLRLSATASSSADHAHATFQLLCVKRHPLAAQNGHSGGALPTPA